MMSFQINIILSCICLAQPVFGVLAVEDFLVGKYHRFTDDPAFIGAAHD